jgi:arylsulfatase A-like enzyme
VTEQHPDQPTGQPTGRHRAQHPDVPEHARGYERFPGRIGQTAATSTRAWPRPRSAREGAPNVIVVILDDMGYSDVAPFGSEIATPALSALADRGYRLTNYHTTPVCSPARAALMTGLNPHRAGFASVANSDPGFPNLRLEIDQDVATLPESLRAAGYATYGFGKWHLTRDALMHDGADKASWPLQRGFDHFYGTLEGCNSFFHPNQLVRDNTPVDRDEWPADYYLTDDLTDDAIAQLATLRAQEPDKPFFLYFAHHAMHGPLGAKPADIAAQRDRYAAGWDEVRRARHARQIELGIFPPHTPLPPSATEPGFDVPAWDSLDPATQDLYARYMEVYAAMVANVDENLGRLLQTVEDLGELDNTIVVFTSDNGGTAEGGPEGTRSYFSRFVHIAGLPQDWENDVERDPDLIGTPRTMVHYPRGWGQVSNTPFRFYKGQTHAGGVRVPFFVSWPAGLPRSGDDDGLRRQYQYVTDLTPTILDLVGVERLAVRDGHPTQEIDGVSLRPVLASPTAASTHPEQYAEFGGSRGYYRDGWKLVSLHTRGRSLTEPQWELYHVDEDPNELVDLAEKEPDRVAELSVAWQDAAWRNTVFPLGAAFAPGRRPAEQALARPVRLLPSTRRLERYRSSKLTSLRSFDVVAEVAAAGEGILVAHGDQGGGYALYVEGGILHLAYNEYGRLHELPLGAFSSGTVRASFTWLPDFRWKVEVTVDDEPRGGFDAVTMLVGMAPFSGIDVGVNRGGPVHWDLYERHGAFRFTGRLVAVTYVPGEHADYDPDLVAQVEEDVAEYYD